MTGIRQLSPWRAGSGHHTSNAIKWAVGALEVSGDAPGTSCGICQRGRAQPRDRSRLTAAGFDTDQARRETLVTGVDGEGISPEPARYRCSPPLLSRLQTRSRPMP